MKGHMLFHGSLLVGFSISTHTCCPTANSSTTDPFSSKGTTATTRTRSFLNGNYKSCVHIQPLFTHSTIHPKTQNPSHIPTIPPQIPLSFIFLQQPKNPFQSTTKVHRRLKRRPTHFRTATRSRAAAGGGGEV